VLLEPFRQPVLLVHRSHSSSAFRHRNDERNRSIVTRRCASMPTVTASAVPTRGHIVAYCVTTVLVAAQALVGGLSEVLQARYVGVTMEHLGYPACVTTILGVWKLAAVVPLLAPRWPRVKEWAYGGMFFDLTGAVASHLAVGDGIPAIVAPTILTGLVVASWALRSPSRRL